MSLTSIVSSAYSPQYDIMDDDGGRTTSSYDPAFTADIAIKMSVPHRIGAVGRHDGYDLRSNNMGYGYQDSRLQGITSMNVPDKIILLGRPTVSIIFIGHKL